MNKYLKYFLLIFFLVFFIELIHTFYSLNNGIELSEKTFTSQISNINQSKPFLNILFLGDSIGAGVGAEKLEETAYYKFSDYLSNYFSINISNKAVSGNKVEDLLDDEILISNQKFNLTIMIISSNDLFRFTPKEEFESNVEKLFSSYLNISNKIIILGPGRVFEVSGIPFFMKPLYKARSSFYGDTITNISYKYSNIFHVNPLKNIPVGEFYDIEAKDNFHPNNQGHTYWFELIKYGFNESSFFN